MRVKNKKIISLSAVFITILATIFVIKSGIFSENKSDVSIAIKKLNLYASENTYDEITPHGLGDINDDGIINDEDVNLIHSAVAKIIELTDDQKLRADIDKDGELKLTDALALQKYIAALVLEIDGNTTWSKSHEVTILKESGYYTIQSPEGNSERKAFSKGDKVDFTGYTGQCTVKVEYTDSDGNQQEFTSKPFYLDNKVTKITKGVNVDTKKSGIFTALEQKIAEDGKKYFEDEFEDTPIVRLKIQEGEDLESGLKSTTYLVEEVLDDGILSKKTEGNASEMGDGITLEEYGTYKITITSTDNLDNVGTDTYYIYIKEKDNVLNENNSSNTNMNSKEGTNTSTSNKVLPYAGNSKNIIVIIVIAILAIGTSYFKYSKYKDI